MEPLVALERTIEILLLARDHVAQFVHRALQVREFFFDGFEAVGHGRQCASIPVAT